MYCDIAWQIIFVIFMRCSNVTKKNKSFDPKLVHEI